MNQSKSDAQAKSGDPDPLLELVGILRGSIREGLTRL
jgi:hypothetical protein